MAILSTSNFHPAAPLQASLAGYKDLVFYDDFVDTSGIDMANSQTGNFNWYLSQWFNHGNVALSTQEFSVANSILTIGSANCLVSAFDTNPQVPDQFQGNVFGGGAYIEASLNFNPAQGGGCAFYGMSIEHIADGATWNQTDAVGLGHWPGQPAHYSHFVEVDIFETLANNTTAYQAHVHDWQGNAETGLINITNNDSYWINADLSNPAAYHTYGCLWVPRTSLAPGRIQFYFDNVLKSTLYYYGPVDGNWLSVFPPLPGQSNGNWSPSNSGNAAQTYAIIDNHRLALSLNGPKTCPLNVDWVKVWK